LKITTIGILIFCILYGYASTLYPGGSQADISSMGYDWINNYWCNLLSETAENGQKNHSRPIAITAMIILCVSLMLFCWQFANTFSKNRNWKNLIKISGFLSMASATLIFTELHDIMIIISSFFGLFAIIGIIREVYTRKMKAYISTGLVCILLLGLNNIIYFSGYYIVILPLLQKITFAVVLLWILSMNWKIINSNS